MRSTKANVYNQFYIQEVGERQPQVFPAEHLSIREVTVFVSGKRSFRPVLWIVANVAADGQVKPFQLRL